MFAQKMHKMLYYVNIKTMYAIWISTCSLSILHLPSRRWQENLLLCSSLLLWWVVLLSHFLSSLSLKPSFEAVRWRTMSDSGRTKQTVSARTFPVTYRSRYAVAHSGTFCPVNGRSSLLRLLGGFIMTHCWDDGGKVGDRGGTGQWWPALDAADLPEKLFWLPSVSPRRSLIDLLWPGYQWRREVGSGALSLPDAKHQRFIAATWLLD